QCWQLSEATLMQAAPSNVPWVEYDFTPTWSGPTHIWIRAQAGSLWSKQWHGANPGHNPQVERKLTDYQKAVFWQIDGQTVQGGVFNNLPADGGETLPDNAKWRWLKLGPATTTQNVQSTLKLYQGSSGFMVDKIIFTNEPGGMVVTAVDNLDNGAPSANLQTLLQEKSRRYRQRHRPGLHPGFDHHQPIEQRFVFRPVALA
ncbi:MAG: hypothetical protein HYR94_23190, partial [Chloroflexi bacterium]|nr:hypothetical protein [Chloroflexota bacterium]